MCESMCGVVRTREYRMFEFERDGVRDKKETGCVNPSPLPQPSASRHAICSRHASNPPNRQTQDGPADSCRGLLPVPARKHRKRRLLPLHWGRGYSAAGQRQAPYLRLLVQHLEWMLEVVGRGRGKCEELCAS